MSLRIGIIHYLTRNSKSILDIGCGDGGAYSFCFMGKEVLGIDQDLNALKNYRLGEFEALVADVTKLPLKPRCFDFVVCSEVLEHLEYKDAAKLLDNLETYARVGVIISTPTRFRPHMHPGKPLQLHRCLIKLRSYPLMRI